MLFRFQTAKLGKSAGPLRRALRYAFYDWAREMALAKQINKHLSRYTPIDRFATAVFLVLNRDSGELAYVNAGHNAPILFSAASTTFLAATGLPLGLFADAQYEACSAVLSRGSSLLLFSDGLTDSIHAEHPEDCLCAAFADTAGQTMANLKSLVDPKYNEDDVAILLVKRSAGSVSTHRGVYPAH